MYTDVDFSTEEHTVEISAYSEDGVYELPEIFHIRDDNIIERAEWFTIYSTVDINTCFDCDEKSHSTQIVIIDDDCKLINIFYIPH